MEFYVLFFTIKSSALLLSLLQIAEVLFSFYLHADVVELKVLTECNLPASIFIGFSILHVWAKFKF